jgi:hypothetical protein
MAAADRRAATDAREEATARAVTAFGLLVEAHGVLRRIALEEDSELRDEARDRIAHYESEFPDVPYASGGGHPES